MEILQGLVGRLAASIFIVKFTVFFFYSVAYGTNIFLKNGWRDFRLPMSILARVARNSFNGKSTANIDFPIVLLLLILTLEV